MDQDHEDERLSAFEFDIVREAFRKSVSELNLAEAHWAEHAELLFRELTDHEPDETVVSRIIWR